jgi:8-oxo-dGTP diphosphatase
MRMSVTVDLVILTIREQRLSALLVRRGIPPYRGRWALPGGFVEEREDLGAAALRELSEETGLRARDVHLEQLRTYGRPGRDPRGRVVTVAHLALAPDLPAPRAGSDAAHAEWVTTDEAVAAGPRLAFDHEVILADGIERARSKLEYTPLGTAFCPDTFTVGELRRVYEAVWGHAIDPRNFHRKVTGSPGFLVDTGERTNRDGGRPARLFRRGDAELLHPPLLRGE